MVKQKGPENRWGTRISLRYRDAYALRSLEARSRLEATLPSGNPLVMNEVAEKIR